MRKLVRVCARAYDGGESLAFVSILVVAWIFLMLELFSAVSPAFPVRPGAYLLDYWLLLVLGLSFAAWCVLRSRGRVDPSVEPGFALAAFGLLARHYCLWFLYGLSETWGSHSLVEETAGERLRFLIAVHKYGGLVAFAVGLGLVLWASVWRGRGGTPPPGSPRPAGRPRGAPAPGGLPASPR